MANKTKEIENHLIKHKTITSWEAITNYRVTRLADVIFRLKARGWIFNTTKQKSNSGAYYAEYELTLQGN